MSPRREAGEVAPARIDELEPVDGFGEIGDRTDAQLHPTGLPEFSELDKSFCMLPERSNHASRGDPSMALQFRRIVTGHDETGRAVVKIDEVARNFVSSR